VRVGSGRSWKAAWRGAVTPVYSDTRDGSTARDCPCDGDSLAGVGWVGSWTVNGYSWNCSLYGHVGGTSAYRVNCASAIVACDSRGSRSVRCDADSATAAGQGAACRTGNTTSVGEGDRAGWSARAGAVSVRDCYHTRERRACRN